MTRPAPLASSASAGVNPSVGESRQWLILFDDVGREHLTGLRAYVQGVVGGAWGDEERIAGVQSEGRSSVEHHLNGPGDDVPDLLARVQVPARLDAGRDLGEHLDDLPPRNRRCAVLELGALELVGQGVQRLRRHRTQPTACSAERMTSLTWPGREIMIRCEPSSSTISALARFASDRITSAPAALSPVATTAQLGRFLHAATPDFSSNAAAATGL